MSYRIFALTTRGLESLSAAEMAALLDVTVRDVAYRRVTATCAGDLSPLLTLRTVDDIFLDVATWHNLVRQRVALSALEQQAAQLDLRAAAKLRTTLLPTPYSQIPNQNASRGLPNPRFSITVSFVGKRNYTTDEIKQRVAAAITKRYGWGYEPNDANANLNLRIFMEHDTAYVGMRLGDKPLHRRGYKHAHVLGSLKPPVAFALLALADVAPDDVLLDPCCGAGTVLVEGTKVGARALGGDLVPESLMAALANIRDANITVPLAHWDARRLPLPDASVDAIVSNPPWGRAVAADIDIAAFYRNLCAELRRVLRPGGRVALLTSVPELVRLPGIRLKTQMELSLFGQQPTILVFS